MQIIYAIDPRTHHSARVHIGCEGYRDLFIEFLITTGHNVAITDEEKLPERSVEEQDIVNMLMEAFKHELDSRVLN